MERFVFLTRRLQRALLGLAGVLVGYPFGGLSDALWSRGAPFLLLASALSADLGEWGVGSARARRPRPARLTASAAALQCALPGGAREPARRPRWREACGLREARRGAGGACAGAVLLTTSVMATLEPCLPLWLLEKFHARRWAAGAAFVPDSVGYLAAASLLGGVAARVGAERVALLGCAAVGLAALLVPLAGGLAALAAPHALLGLGLGATDAALLPALLTRRRARAAPTAALLQAAASAAYALGPALGGLASWALGFETTMRALGVLNLLYAAFLYRALALHPLSEQVRRVPRSPAPERSGRSRFRPQWGAGAADDSDEDDSDDGGDASPAPVAPAPPTAAAPLLPMRCATPH